MVKVQRDASALESEIKPLIDVANTKEWKSVLNILYLNGSVLAFSEEMRVPCLVSVTGPVEDVDRSIDLLLGRSKTNLTPLIVALAKFFIPKILAVVEKAQTKTPSAEAVSEDEEKKVMMMISGLLLEMEKNQRRLTKTFIDSAFTISELITVGAFNRLCEFRDSHIHASVDEDDYEDMVEGLRKLGVIQAQLQVNLCPECANYGLTISNFPSFNDICPKCGAEWVSEVLYTFKRSFDKIKSKNLDLPLFISGYLKHQVSMQAPFADFEAHPCAVIPVDQQGTQVEVDVYLPQLKAGIECKVYEDAFAPMTESRVGSMVGELLGQVRKYTSLGIDKVHFVTNLPAGSAEKVRASLEGAMSKENLKLTNFEVVGGDVESLLKWLDQFASNIAQIFVKTLERRMSQFQSEVTEPKATE